MLVGDVYSDVYLSAKYMLVVLMRIVLTMFKMVV